MRSRFKRCRIPCESDSPIFFDHHATQVMRRPAPPSARTPVPNAQSRSPVASQREGFRFAGLSSVVTGSATRSSMPSCPTW